MIQSGHVRDTAQGYDEKRVKAAIACILLDMSATHAETLRARYGDVRETLDPEGAHFHDFCRDDPERARRAEKFFKEGLVEKELEIALRHGIAIVSIEDEQYPALLKQIAHPPAAFYVKGARTLADAVCVSIVGTRHPSHYGIAMAQRFSMELASYGITIVSGFAQGIDIAAHTACITAGGRTIAVLGTGLLRDYPVHYKKYAPAVAQHGALISEFPLYAPPHQYHFPRRNRIISGLSYATLVIEASRKSGALLTAHYAVEQNRDVYAIPGPIDSARFQGNHVLIREGACLVESAEDVVEGLRTQVRGFLHEMRPSIRTPHAALTGDKKRIYELLETPRHVEALIESLDMSVARISKVLLEMRQEGYLEEPYPRTYVRKDRVLWE